MSWYKKALYSIKSKDGKEYFLSDWPKQEAKPTESTPLKDKWVSVDSSFISEVSYYAPLKILDVRMKSGKIYSFINVPKSTYTRFMNSQSKGEFFNRVIKRRYKTK